MKISTSKNGDVICIDLEGDIDERGAEEMKRVFREVVIAGCGKVEVNFAKVTHIGSAGIGKLLVLYRDLAVRGGGLSVVNVPGPIHGLLCEMKLDSIFTVTGMQ